MSTQRVCVLVISFFLAARFATAQEHQHPEPQKPSAQATAQHDHSAMSDPFVAREASGTAWLPELSEMYALHGSAAGWQLMFHGNAFLQLLHEAADAERGDTQAGSINWIMAMARRNVGAGRFGLRGMFSLEPATIPGCAYPDLLASGEVCDGEAIHDRQHPHDLFMELAAEYERPLRGSLRWQLYGGLAGEPAIGPVAFPHRLSAMPNPLAPVAHHWLDATHVTFGVVTTGVFTRRWKAEASLFNGREPDDDRWDVNIDPWDSLSGRLTLTPTASLALQVSAAHLNEAETGPEALARVDVNRVTASVTYHRRLQRPGFWATTVAWGRNEESGTKTHALLAESSVTLNQRDVWFGRFEVAGKEAHDLHVEEFGDEVFIVSKVVGGYTRYLASAAGLRLGLGGHLSAGVVPEGLKPTYGHRANLGLGFYVTVRPGAQKM